MNPRRDLAPGVSAQFDYSALNAEAAALAKTTAHKIKLHQQRTSAEIIEIGTELISVQKAIGHGHFGRWLEAEFGWTDRTARNYMRAAERFGAKSETISVLPQTTIYLLAAKSTPDAIVGEVIGKLEAGETVDPGQIEDQVLTARKEAKEEKKRQVQKQARGSRKARLEREERQRQEREEERRRAAAVADDLIREFGIVTVKKVFEATQDVNIRLAMAERLRPESAEAAS
jgi:hypothetical protein